MQTLEKTDRTQYARMSTAELREAFLVQEFFQPGEVKRVQTALDGARIGSAMPNGRALTLDLDTGRYESGVINLGGPGTIHCEGKCYGLGNLDLLYVSRDVGRLKFNSDDAERPALFYLVQYPAQTSHPTRLIRKSEAQTVVLGRTTEANRRTLRKYIHADGAKSCQLVMGVTELDAGNVWNTMPCHTHTRRSEVYLYFNLDPAARVFHFMGTPEQTRHLVVGNHEAVLSPRWSIHTGSGTQSYAFVWAMGGENQDFADIDLVATNQLR